MLLLFACGGISGSRRLSVGSLGIEGLNLHLEKRGWVVYCLVGCWGPSKRAPASLITTHLRGRGLVLGGFGAVF